MDRRRGIASIFATLADSSASSRRIALIQSSCRILASKQRSRRDLPWLAG